MSTDTVTVRWTTTETTTYQAEIETAEWARMQADSTYADELAEFEESANERRYENDREIEEPA